MPRGLRIAAMLGGLGLAVLVAVTIALVFLESIDRHAAMSQDEYTRTRWTQGAEK